MEDCWAWILRLEKRVFTPRGVAAAGLAVDAGSGVTYGSFLAQKYQVVENVAYPRVQSQLLVWHKALRDEVGITPMLAAYVDKGGGLFEARFIRGGRDYSRYAVVAP